MQKTKELLKKVDIKFVGLCLAGIVLCCALIMFAGGGSLDNKDLPDEYDSNFTKLIINEVVSQNKGVYADENGNVADYIELYNSTNKDIDLSGYGLSDEEKQIKWAFSGVIIKANSYLVVSLTGNNNANKLEANFKLSSSNSERIILTNPSGKIIDALDTQDIVENGCMARDENGAWYISSYCTPGYENSYKGLQEYHDSLFNTDSELEIVVNEFLARNNGNYLSESNKGYIELKNISNKNVNLSDYFISNDEYLPFKYKLTNKTLSPNEVYVINMGDSSYFKEDYLGFNFSSREGNIVLAKDGKIVQNITYSNLNNGDCLCYENGSYVNSAIISKGYDNDAVGVEKFQSEYLKNNEGLIINEVMNNNSAYLIDAGNYYDWIELYNNSDNDINLSNYYLSDTSEKINMYQLPNYVLKAHEYFVIQCSGDEALTNEAYYHANFKLSENTGLFLSKANRLIDVMHIGNMPLGYSYGRSDIDGYYYIDTPSPLVKNNKGCRDITSKPTINVAGGIYNNIDTISVSISSFGDVYYTTDGSIPTTNSKKYNEAIVLNKTTVIKARSFVDGKLGSDVATESYIINENHTLPVVSLSLDQSDLYSINVNFKAHDYNKQAYVEFFDGKSGFESNCGIGLFGDESRQYSKKNYCLRFDGDFNAQSIKYKLFENRDNVEYEVLALRAGGQDWDEGIIRDNLMTSVADENPNITTFANRSVIVYINGQYWGLYTLKEKKSKAYFRENFNINTDNLNLMRSSFQVEWGTGDFYQEIMDYFTNNDTSSKECFDWISKRIDIEAYADYFITHLYVCNLDYYNIRLFQSDDYDGGKMHLVFFDLDFAMIYDASHNGYVRALGNPNGFQCSWGDGIAFHTSIDNTVIRCLLKNEYFEKLWLERLDYCLKNYYNEKMFNKYIDKITSEYEPEIARDRTRWGQSLDVYKGEINKIKNFISKRQDYILKYTKEYFKLSDEEMNSYFGDLYE